MKRRMFVLGGVAGLIVSKARVMADDPLLKDLKNQRLAVGHRINGDQLQPEFSVTGCELNIEEDDHTLFDFRFTNGGPKSVRLVHCQPFTTGPSWEIIQRFPGIGAVSFQEIKHSWRCCNDSNFFFIEINSSGAAWTPIDVATGSGSIRPAGGSTVARIEWHQPQEVIFEIWGRKGGESGHC